MPNNKINVYWFKRDSGFISFFEASKKDSKLLLICDISALKKNNLMILKILKKSQSFLIHVISIKKNYSLFILI